MENLFKKRMFSPDFLIFFLKFHDIKKALLHLCVWGKCELGIAEKELALLKACLLAIPHDEYLADYDEEHTFEKDLDGAIEYLRKTVRDLRSNRKQLKIEQKQPVGYY
jgi:hypothetical protein